METRSRTNFREEMEELLAFKAPPSSLDPEAWGQEGAALEESDEELYDATGKGREASRLRGSIDMGDDEAYMGQRASRDGFFGTETKNKLREKTSDLPTVGGFDDEGSSDEGSSDDERNGHGGGLGSAEADDDDDDDMEALEREMLEAEKAEAQAVEELKDRRAKEYEKAKAVKVQKRLWQSGLEARIMMQKVLQGANKLPGAEAHTVLEDVDPVLAQEMRGVASDAKRTLGDLCEILDCLAEINPAVVSRATGAKPSKRRRVGEEDGLRACWAALDARYTDFGAFRDASLDRWHRKTMIESGKTSTSSMKILNQGISKQVGLLMKDVDRMAARSRLRAAEFQGLCQVRGITVRAFWKQSKDEAVERWSDETMQRGGVGSFTDVQEMIWKCPPPSFVPACATHPALPHRLNYGPRPRRPLALCAPLPTSN